MPWLSDLKRALQGLGEPAEPQHERWPAAGLTALYGVDCASTPARIKDISTSGIYLFTEERLRAGELMTLILRKEGEPENSSELQFSVHARTASQGEDGIDLSFVLPLGMDLELWGVLIRNLVVLTDPDQVAETFRTLRTILFLCRLCQSEVKEPIFLLDGHLDADRTATLFKIALAAENLLASEPDGGRMRAHPTLVANILREGSWALDDLTMQLWVGLLSSSCSVEAPDDSNQVFVDLLVEITHIEAKIFIHACERALSSAPGPENSASGSIVLGPKEMIEVTGVYDLTRNATDLAYLFNLGLIQKVFDFTSYHDMVSFDITPSSLGLELYKNCRGRREKIEPHLVEVAKEHLAVFFPPPISSALDKQTPPSPISPSGS